MEVCGIEKAKELFKMRIETEEYSGMTTNTLKEAMTTVLEELEEYEKALDIFDEREYRKKYLEEERAIRPNLLYPDADEIYQKYFQQRAELEKKDKVINEMAEYVIDLIKYNNSEEERDKEEIKEYFTKKVEGE